MLGVLDSWPSSLMTLQVLLDCVDSGLLRLLWVMRFPKWIIPTVDAREPNLLPGYMVSFLAFHDQGIGIWLAGL